MLRPYEAADAETRYRIHSDPAVLAYTGGARLSRAQSDKYFKAYLSRHKAGTNCCLLVLDRITDAPLGDCLLLRFPPTDPELVLALLPEARGKGISFEPAGALTAVVFASAPLGGIVAKVQPSNRASLGLCAKVGMVLVGSQPNHWDEAPDLVYRLARPVHGA